MEKTAKLREPNLELSKDATERLTKIAKRPNDPSAAKVNVARAVEAFRQRKAALRQQRRPAAQH